MTRDEQERQRYQKLRRTAEIFTPPALAGELEDIIHDAVLAGLRAQPDQDWLALPANYFTLAIKSRIATLRHRFKTRTPKNPYLVDSLDGQYRTTAGEEFAFGELLPGRHDTEREALVNVTLEAVLARAHDHHVATVLTIASGHATARDLAHQEGHADNTVKSRRRRAAHRLREELWA